MGGIMPDGAELANVLWNIERELQMGTWRELTSWKQTNWQKPFYTDMVNEMSTEDNQELTIAIGT